jgi:hypothetical protein
VTEIKQIQMFLCNRSENAFQLEQIFEVYINEIEPLFSTTPEGMTSSRRKSKLLNTMIMKGLFMI